MREEIVKTISLDTVSLKDGEIEEEVKHLKELFSLPFHESLLYLQFIKEKNLFKEFAEWRKKRVLEVV